MVDLLTLMLTERVSEFAKNRKEEKKRKTRSRDKRIAEELVRLRIIPTRENFIYFSLHENPYFIEDLINPPNNPFQYKDL